MVAVRSVFRDLSHRLMLREERALRESHTSPDPTQRVVALARSTVFRDLREEMAAVLDGTDGPEDMPVPKVSVPRTVTPSTVTRVEGIQQLLRRVDWELAALPQDTPERIQTVKRMKALTAELLGKLAWWLPRGPG